MEIGEVEKWRIKPLREGETIVGFYERNGFVKLNEDHSGNTCLMYYDLLDFKGQL